jgi:hypothetical protein
MSHIKIVVTFEKREFKIKVTRDTTVGMLMIKIRKFLKLRPEQGLFLFWPRRFRSDALYPASKLLCEIQSDPAQVLQCNLLRENCFGTLSKMFVKARIEERSGLFCAVITWSYYGLYHYDEVSIHSNINEATEHLLKIRCNGCLSLEKK